MGNAVEKFLERDCKLQGGRELDKRICESGNNNVKRNRLCW